MPIRSSYPSAPEAMRAVSVQFNELERRITPRVSADNGDAAATLTPGQSAPTQRWATALTADRAVTLADGWTGAKFRIVRTGGGAFNLNVGAGPLKALAENTWADVEFTGSAWVLTAYGAL